jgi:RNA polymerase sigma factor (sigma-70 family)
MKNGIKLFHYESQLLGRNRLIERNKLSLFEETFLPHLDAAHNLARWIMNNDQDAEDMVQESFLRAYKFYSGFKGGNSRSWLLTIVRNTCYTWLHQNRAQALTVELDDEIESSEGDSLNPEVLLQHNASRHLVHQALEKLPIEFRELMVLRELEGLSYKEIAYIAGIPMGTVMSRLARARQKLKECLAQLIDEEGLDEL